MITIKNKSLMSIIETHENTTIYIFMKANKDNKWPRRPQGTVKGLAKKMPINHDIYSASSNSHNIIGIYQNNERRLRVFAIRSPRGFSAHYKAMKINSYLAARAKLNNRPNILVVLDVKPTKTELTMIQDSQKMIEDAERVQFIQRQ